ncbi:MAG: 4-hydroxyphenylpyruvate dioxygenase [Halobacteriovoraceae bacterium]|nr:4-hydroxyphenylpyruvate dioxygenase [Halobacteriovoraceae bacterium]MCB9095387.1 4-hydroxyphenylpyruvate dioxygenase [Halobacteriovoraceae bacterium]
MSKNNPTGLKGIEFVEFCSNEPTKLHNLFKAFGFSKLMTTADGVDYYKQNGINFLLNKTSLGHSADFKKVHGPSICSMGFRVEDANKAYQVATEKGAKPASEKSQYQYKGETIPAIYGIGDSLIYFIDQYNSESFYKDIGFQEAPDKEVIADKGFMAIDHLTNNVYKGTMEEWSKFYKNIFGFTEVRYFDIKGVKTGLVSYALQSPCESFCIPINEGTEAKSQINEYLEEYNGPGIQHLAFLTNDIVKSLSQLNRNEIETLDIDDQYYEEVFDRVPNVTEDHKELQKYNILVDGDKEGYLLQIFTKNVVGPIFIEIIQRKNHKSFGEGNFGALFRSIEKDQEKRGYLK